MSSEPKQERLGGQQVDAGAMIRQMYGSKRAVLDTSIPPVLFVTANSFVGLGWAAAAAAAYGLGTAGYRAIRRQESRQALFGLLGLGFALAIALRTGRASNYFLPNVISGFALGAAAFISAAMRKPLTALLAQTLTGKPIEHARVLRAHIVVTLGWGVWFCIRSGVRAYLIATDNTAGLGFSAVFMGVPATLGLVVASFAYIRWRAHGVEHETPDAPPASDPGLEADRPPSL